MSPTRDLRTTLIVALALVAAALKLAIAYNTIGTNDAVFFYGFAKVLNEHGLEWTYAHSRYFNHPPLTAYFLRGIFLLTEQNWCQDLGIHFPFSCRSRFASVPQDRHRHSNLGARAFRAEPGLAHGLRISWQHRSGDGLVFGLRGLDVLAESVRARRIIFRAQLPDQNCPAPAFAGARFLLVVTKSEPAVFNYRRGDDGSLVERAIAQVSDSLFEKCSRIRKLLGNLGNHLFVSFNRIARVQPALVF